MSEKTIGQYLKELRKAYGYSQEYVASYLNIIHQTYSHYETGRIVPPADALYHLAKFYDIPVENLMELTVSNPSAAHRQSAAGTEDKLGISGFLNYVNDPENEKRLKNLSKSEKELIYYYSLLSLPNQKKFLDMIKLEYKYQKKF